MLHVSDCAAVTALLIMSMKLKYGRSVLLQNV